MRAARWITASVLLVMTLIWAGCSTSGGTGGKMEGIRIRWVLKSYESKGATRTAPGSISIDALFQGGKVGGFSGVNTYQGSYKLSGSSLSVGKLASITMAGPKDLMDAEQAYLAALQLSSNGTLTGSAGVNEYSSTYQSQGLNISIAPPLVTTNNTSADAAITRQEKDYLAALQLAAKYNIQGNRLDLLRADGGFAVTFESAR